MAYLVNPQSFLTAVSQVAAQKNQWELDKLVTYSDVTRYAAADAVETVAREGAYISGLNMQGARWDSAQSIIDKSKPKEMFCAMPVSSKLPAPTKQTTNKNACARMRTFAHSFENASFEEMRFA